MGGAASFGDSEVPTAAGFPPQSATAAPPPRSTAALPGVAGSTATPTTKHEAVMKEAAEFEHALESSSDGSSDGDEAGARGEEQPEQKQGKERAPETAQEGHAPQQEPSEEATNKLRGEEQPEQKQGKERAPETAQEGHAPQQEPSEEATNKLAAFLASNAAAAAAPSRQLSVVRMSDDDARRRVALAIASVASYEPVVSRSTTPALPSTPPPPGLSYGAARVRSPPPNGRVLQNAGEGAARAAQIRALAELSKIQALVKKQHAQLESHDAAARLLGERGARDISALRAHAEVDAFRLHTLYARAAAEDPGCDLRRQHRAAVLGRGADPALDLRFLGV